MKKDEKIQNKVKELLNNILLPNESTIYFWGKGIDVYIDGEIVSPNDNLWHHLVLVKKQGNLIDEIEVIEKEKYE
jgi:hypothetical protein